LSTIICHLRFMNLSKSIAVTSHQQRLELCQAALLVEKYSCCSLLKDAAVTLLKICCSLFKTKQLQAGFGAAVIRPVPVGGWWQLHSKFYALLCVCHRRLELLEEQRARGHLLLSWRPLVSWRCRSTRWVGHTHHAAQMPSVFFRFTYMSVTCYGGNWPSKGVAVLTDVIF